MRDPPLFVCQFYFSFLGKIVRVKFIDDVKAVKKNGKSIIFVDQMAKFS